MFNYTENELTELLAEAEKSHANYERREASLKLAEEHYDDNGQFSEEPIAREPIAWPQYYARFILADSKARQSEATRPNDHTALLATLPFISVLCGLVIGLLST